MRILRVLSLPLLMLVFASSASAVTARVICDGNLQSKKLVILGNVKGAESRLEFYVDGQHIGGTSQALVRTQWDRSIYGQRYQRVTVMNELQDKTYKPVTLDNTNVKAIFLIDSMGGFASLGDLFPGQYLNCNIDLK